MSYSNSGIPSSLKSTRSWSVLETIKEAKRGKKCILCGRGTVNELTLGTLFCRDGVTCHYYCLLFCCNIRQNGTKDTDGILGFLTKDIRKEVGRVTSKKYYNFYKCRFCKKPGATIGCFVKKCRMLYHFPCGLQNGVKFRFTSRFDSYCKSHAGPDVFKPIVLSDCPVCAESLENRTLVFGRCCSNSNFHKECIQAYALRAGIYHLKCPLCADKDIFLPDIQSQGIFVPIKDADWETEKKAYQELRQRYSHCDAQECLCPSGRDRNDRYNGSGWHLLRCGSCAASAIHVNCTGSVNLVDNDFVLTKWLCPVCLEVDRRLEEKQNTLPAKPSDITDSSDNESSLHSTSSAESLFTPVFVRRNMNNSIPKPLHQTEVGESDDNSSVSSEDTLFEVVTVSKAPLNHNSQSEMDSFSPSPGIDQPTATDPLDTIKIQDIKREYEDAEESQCLILFSSFYGCDFDNEDDLSTCVSSSSSSNDELETHWRFPVAVDVEPMQDVNDEVVHNQSPDPVLSFHGSDVEEDDFSTKRSGGMDVEVVFPVVGEEPQRRWTRRVVNEDLPAFKISETQSDENDLKQVRCYCERYWDDEALIKCPRCSILLHKNCLAGIHQIYGKSLQARCCQLCTKLPALKKPQEIPLSGKYIAKGCENTKEKTYYLTLVNKANGMMVRRLDTVYISEKDVESSRILRVEKLWKDTRGTRYISGHYYYKPFETANATTRMFYRKEVFRSTTATESAIKMGNVVGRCWVLDPVTYCKGRPSPTTLHDERHVYICESWMDFQTKRISLLKLANSTHSVCMKPDVFKEFVAEMKIKKDYRVKGLATIN